MGLKRVLIVEDDEDFQSLMAMRLKHSGYQCAQAYSVAQGLKMFQDSPPDFILLDLGFRDFSDGTDFISCLKNQAESYHMRAPPVVVMSAFMTDELRASLEKNDMVKGCYSKPLDSRMIMDKIRQYCH